MENVLRKPALKVTSIVSILILLLVSMGWIWKSNQRLKGMYNAWYDRRNNLPIMVTTAMAENGDIEQLIFASGIAEARDSVTVECQVRSGRIAELPFEVGDRVSEGDLVVRIQSPEAVTERQNLKLNVELLRTRIERYELELKVLRQQFSKNLIPKNELDLAEFRLREAKIELSQALNALAAAEDQCRHLDIYSTLSGIILDRPVRLHEAVYPRKILFVVGSVDPILIRARIAEENIRNVSIGQDVAVTADIYPGQEFSGALRNVEGNIDPKTRSFSALVEVFNPDNSLYPGLTVNVYIKNRKHALHVPSRAVLNAGDEAGLFTVERSTARLKPVKTGVSGGGMTQVLSGIQPGEEVVVYGQFALEDGSRVYVSNTASAQRAP